MNSHNTPINILINEPDIYSEVNIRQYSCVNSIYSSGDKAIDPSQIDAILTGLKDVIDDDFLRAFSRVKYIVSNTTGTDHIKTSRDITVIHLKPGDIEQVSATAEFTLALLLSIVRKIPFIDPERVSDREIYRGVQLRGKTIGIFGMGRLGKKMARYAEALEMKAIGYDRRSTIEDKIRILEASDIISIHLPLKEDTVDFINFNDFEIMKRRPFIINTSRPQLINKAALISALDNNLISGLAMDFINYDGTHLWDSELKKYIGERLLLTPHIAGNTYESIAYTSGVVVNKLISILSEESHQ